MCGSFTLNGRQALLDFLFHAHGLRVRMKREMFHDIQNFCGVDLDAVVHPIFSVQQRLVQEWIRRQLPPLTEREFDSEFNDTKDDELASRLSTIEPGHCSKRRGTMYRLGCSIPSRYRSRINLANDLGSPRFLSLDPSSILRLTKPTLVVVVLLDHFVGRMDIHLPHGRVLFGYISDGWSTLKCPRFIDHGHKGCETDRASGSYRLPLIGNTVNTKFLVEAGNARKLLVSLSVEGLVVGRGNGRGTYLSSVLRARIRETIDIGA